MYGMLQMMQIQNEFDTLLKIIMPQPEGNECEIQHMLPLKWLAWESDHTAWMSEYYEKDGDMIMTAL